MGLFGKKKNTEPPAPAPQLTPTQMIQQEQIGMDKARKALDQLVEELNELQQPAFEGKMMKAAQENEATADKNMMILESVRENRPAEAYRTEERLALEDGLYIMPEELQEYRTMIRAVNGAYTFNMSAAEACAVGADEIDPLLLPYVRKLGEALADGQKLKADVCCEVLKYAVLVVHKRPIEGKNEETARKIIDLRKNTVDDVFWNGVRTADSIYAAIAALHTHEEAYEERRTEFGEYKRKLDAIPEEYQKQFDVIGFAGAAKLPIGHPLRKYLHVEIQARAALCRLELAMLDIETYTAKVERLRSNLEQFRQEAKIRYATEQGMDYDEAEALHSLRRITERAVQEISSMNREEQESYEMNKRFESLIHAAAADQGTVDNAMEARDRIKMYDKAASAFNDFDRIYAENLAKPPKQENEPQVIEQPEEENKIMADMG